MKLVLPENIFSSVIAGAFSDDSIEILYRKASLTSRELCNDSSAVALIPSLDLINHKQLFVSSGIGLAFDGQLSNSYLYFSGKERRLSKIMIRGDISVNEIILTKILFAERFNSEIELILDPASYPEKDNDCLVAGNENFMIWNYENGLSFSDLVSEMLELPYVNFVFASKDKNAIMEINEYTEGIDFEIEDRIEAILAPLPYSAEVKSYIAGNLNSAYFQMTENESQALNELVKLVYYHRIIDDMFDVNYIG
jgi:hypothetical protein